MSIASLYPSINPSLLLDFANVKRLDPRITFTRTTTATYYDGVTTAKAEENLLTYSQEFDNAVYAKTNVTVTANSVAAPDGTTTADTVTQSAGTNYKIIDQPITGSAGQSYAVSVYAKAGTNNYIQLLFGGSNTDFANFDLSGAGAVGTVSGFTSGTTATITSVGNSWFRCVVSWSSLGTAFTSVGVCLIPSSTSARAATTANTNTVYLWGMQMEQRSSATAYTATTSQAITNYIPVLQTAAAGQARFDHNPTTGESLGLLIEEARTNLFLYSSGFDGSIYYVEGGSYVNDQTIAPNGTLTADLIREGTLTYTRSVESITVTNGQTYTFSAYLKAGFRTQAQMQIYSNVTNVDVVFNLSTGQIVSGSGGTITSVGNGWYRCTVTAQVGSTTAIGFIYPAVNGSYTYTHTEFFNALYIWGAQLEAGSFATSYIPTVASSVTRNADAASMTGTNFSSWFNYGAMTIYYEATGYYTASGAYEVFDLDSGSNSGRIRTRFLSSEQASQLDASSNSTFSLDGGTVTANSFAKVAVGLTQNSQALSLNGGAVVTATAPFTTLPVPTTARIGTNWVPSEFLNGTIKKIAFYPVKATNAQLQSLTS